MQNHYIMLFLGLLQWWRLDNTRSIRECYFEVISLRLWNTQSQVLHKNSNTSFDEVPLVKSEDKYDEDEADDEFVLTLHSLTPINQVEDV